MKRRAPIDPSQGALACKTCRELFGTRRGLSIHEKRAHQYQDDEPVRQRAAPAFEVSAASEAFSASPAASDDAGPSTIEHLLDSEGQSLTHDQAAPDTERSVQEANETAQFQPLPVHPRPRSSTLVF